MLDRPGEHPRPARYRRPRRLRPWLTPNDGGEPGGRRSRSWRSLRREPQSRERGGCSCCVLDLALRQSTAAGTFFILIGGSSRAAAFSQHAGRNYLTGRLPNGGSDRSHFGKQFLSTAPRATFWAADISAIAERESGAFGIIPVSKGGPLLALRSQHIMRLLLA